MKPMGFGDRKDPWICQTLENIKGYKGTYEVEMLKYTNPNPEIPKSESQNHGKSLKLTRPKSHLGGKGNF